MKALKILLITLCFTVQLSLNAWCQCDQNVYLPYVLLTSQAGADDNDKYMLHVATITTGDNGSISLSSNFTSQPSTHKLEITIGYSTNSQDPGLVTKEYDITKVLTDANLTRGNDTIAVILTPDGGNTTCTTFANRGNFIATPNSHFYPYASLRQAENDKYTWNTLFHTGALTDNKFWYQAVAFTELVNVVSDKTQFFFMGLTARSSPCSTCDNLIASDQSYVVIQNTLKGFPKSEVRLTTFVDIDMPDPDVTGTSTNYGDDQD